MTLPLFLLALASAVAPALAAPAPVVQLPPSEAAGEWAPILAQAGLGMGVPGAWGASVTDNGDGATWAARVVDKTGKVQVLTVLAPTNAQEREDLAWYLAKLAGAEPPELVPLAPVTPAVVAPSAPIAAPAPPPLPVAVTPSPPAALAPAAAPDAPSPLDNPPARLTPPARPTTTEAPVGFFARVALSADVRGQSSVAASPQLDLGLRAGPVRVAAYGTARTFSELADAGDGRGYSALEFGGGAWVRPELPIGFGLLGGASLRDFRSDGVPVLTVVVPVVAAEGLGHIALGKSGVGSRLGLEPLVRFQYDLRKVQIQVDGGTPTPVPAWELRLGLGVTWGG